MAQRLVVLGASNVARGFAAIVRAAREAWGDPLEVLAAQGVGRSYGMRSAVLGRVLPPITECGLWTELARRPPLPTRAVVADVGNDILYNAPPPAILGWVADCIGRLHDAGAEVTLTGLPWDRLQRLSRPGYGLLRVALFPFHRWLPLQEGRARAHAVHEGLRALAARTGARFAETRIEWYGLDPVHIRLGWRDVAWRALLGAECAASDSPPRGPGSLRLFAARPERQWMLGYEMRRAQPVVSLPSGGSVWLY